MTGAELLFRRKDGSRVVCEIHSVVFMDESGTQQALAVAHDVTQRKRAERALKDSAQRFRQLADAMPQLVWVARPDGVMDYCNERSREFPGLKRRPDGSLNWEAVIHPDDHPATVAAWVQAVRSGEQYEVAHRIRSRNGVYRWYLSRALPTRDDSGRVVRWFGTTTDIDRQKRAELELREADRRKGPGARIAVALVSGWRWSRG